MSSGGGKSTTSTQVVRDPAEQAARNQVMANAGALYNNSPGMTYQGPRPVGMNDGTQRGLSEMVDAAYGAKRDTQTAQNANNFGLHDVLYADSNPYLQSAMDAATKPMIQQFMNAGGPLSAIRNNSVDSGGYGGSRQGIAEGLAMQGLQQKVGDMRTQMSYDAYKTGLDQMQNSIKNQAMLNMMSLMPGQTIAQVGGQYDQAAQQFENYRAASADYQQNAPWRNLQNYANIVYGNNDGGTQTTQTAPKQDNTGQILGSLGTMAMMGMMFSDKRLKRNIAKIGTHAKGFGVYLYNIFGRWEAGVLAQEVQRIVPSAVYRHPSGYLMVNYAAL